MTVPIYELLSKKYFAASRFFESKSPSGKECYIFDFENYRYYDFRIRKGFACDVKEMSLFDVLEAKDFSTGINTMMDSSIVINHLHLCRFEHNFIYLYRKCFEESFSDETEWINWLIQNERSWRYVK